MPEDRPSEPGSQDRPSEPGTQEVLPPADDESGAQAADTRTAVQVRTTESYSGPLPPADQLAAYDKVEPGAANRIIVMAEDYAKHSRALEQTALSLEGKTRLRGQLLGVVVVLAVLGACLIALDLGYEAFAIALGSGTLVALAIVFVLGKVPEWLKMRDLKDPESS